MAEATETALVCIREEVERAFSLAPGAVLEAALSRIAPADECARVAAYAAWDSIAHPLGGLGDFEDAVACIAAAQGSAEVAEFPRALAVFFSDNGVVAEGVSQSGQDVTRAVARNMCEGATSACRMAAFAGAEVVPVDVGMARGIEDARMVRANVRRGSGNIAHGPAMSRDGAVRAIEVGIAVACGLARAGVRLLAAGEMGIGNTTTSAAVAAVLLRPDARSLVGRGAGLSDASLARKRDVVERAIDANSPDPADPIDVLEGGRLRHRGDVRLLPGGRGLEGAGAPRRGHILHGGPVRGASVPQRLGLPCGHPRIKRTRKPGAPSRSWHKGTPRRRHALGRGRGRHGVSTPSGFGAARVPGWEDVHGDWYGCLRAFRGREMTVTLVIGAAASGKSAYAESLCLGHDGPRVYLATMEPFGEEGARRIARHRALREGKGFSTLERTRDVGAAVPGLPRGCTLLLEDVGNLVANELFAEGGLSPRDPDAAAREVLGGIERLARAAAYTVVVTVDVFADGMRYDEGTEAWRRALARVNAGVAALADRAVEVVCGIPVWMKGEGPAR